MRWASRWMRSPLVMRLLDYWAPVVGLGLLVAVLAQLGTATPELERTATTMLVSLVLVVGLYVFAGNSGILSFGHVGFVALGAYVSAILTIPSVQKAAFLPDLPAWLASAQLSATEAAFIAGCCCAVVAFVIGIPLMRLSGIAASIATLALLVIVKEVISKWDAMTGGTQTLVVPMSTTLDGALVWAIAFIVVAQVFQQSRYGLRLRATREEEVAARATGVNPTRERLMAFVLSGFVTGVGGALYGHLIGAFGPGTFYISLTFLVIAMLIIGGIHSLTGAVVGTIVVTAFTEVLRRGESGFSLGFFDVPERPGLQEVGLAVAMLAILIARPEGMFSGRRLRWWRPGAAQWSRTSPPATERSEDDNADREVSVSAGATKETGR